MARRGDAARQSVMNIISSAFGDNLVGIQDKKIYVNAQDGPGGEVIQFAVSLTMPKSPIATPKTKSGGAWDNEDTAPTPTITTMTDEDKEAVDRLMKKLDLPPWEVG